MAGNSDQILLDF